MYEIIAGPIDLYLAPVGTAFPLVNAAPAGAWVKLGNQASKNYAESGVKVKHDQKIAKVHTLGRTGAARAFRDQEGLEVMVDVLDLTLEAYRRALNDAAITVVAAAAGVPGSRVVPLRRGLSVTEYALLAKGGFSPDGAGWSMQYEVNRCYVDGNPEPVFVKNKAAGLALTFSVLEDLNAAAGAEFGYLRTQNADAQ
jgi:hypothetical protein